jgi:hypothetical protein
LKEFIQFNEYQQKLDLPIRNVLPQDSGTISGWGVITNPSQIFSERLMKAHMTVIENSECQQLVGAVIRPTQFCGFTSRGIGPCDVSFILIVYYVELH